MLPFDLPGDVRLVALDISADQLERNRIADEKIVGDLQRIELPGRAFDMIVCWNVLEHLQRPEAAVARMSRWLRVGGTLVIGVPNLWSTKGLVTKFTPHAFHKWVYRHVLGEGDVTPFKTYFRSSISPGSLTTVAAENGLDLVYSEAYSGGIEKKLPRPLVTVMTGLAHVVSALSRGTVDASLSEYVAVFTKSNVSESEADTTSSAPTA